MRFVVALVLLIFGANPGCFQAQCSTCWCPAQQPTIPQGPPRVGKAGPRGLPGPVGEPGIVNLTEMELVLNKRVNEGDERVKIWLSDSLIPNVRLVFGLLTIRSCRNFRPQSAKSKNETGGSFDIFIPDIGRKEVYCDVRTDGGYWIVFQRRMDGSVDFFRDWNDYVNGFGKANGEFWLGLEAIHQLTKIGNYEMRIDMIERDGTYYYAKYSTFKVGSASGNYRLRIDGYSGNITDSIAGSTHSAKNMAFSTRDQDHDTWPRNCAASFKGGWWYRSCHLVNLNGLYGARNSEGLRWYHESRSKDLYMKFTEMKLRLKQ